MESPLLDPTSMTILETAYLARPKDRDGLRAALGEAPTDFDERIDALILGGFVSESGSGLDYTSPYTAFIAIGAARARAMHEETLRTTAMMQALPRLIRAWDISEVTDGGEHPLSVNIIHAVADDGDAWFEHALAEPTVRPSLVYPTLGPLLAALRAGHLDSLQARVPQGGLRVILDAQASPGAELTERLDAARATGIGFRRGRDLPGWLYVDEGSIVGLPILWGDTSPSRMLAIRTPPVVGAMALLFDRLWHAADPWDMTAIAWEPVVRLLAQGLTDEAIARTLDLTTRTVRRRIAEAMDELGASSRFQLGMRWASRS